MTDEEIQSLKLLFENSKLRKTVVSYLEGRTIRKQVLLAIAQLTKPASEESAILPSAEKTNEDIANWLAMFNTAFTDASTRAIHDVTITAINQFKFDQIGKLLTTTKTNAITPEILQSILETPLALMTEENTNESDPKPYTYCEKYSQLLTTVIQCIDEMQQLNLIAQHLRQSKSSAQNYIKDLNMFYTEHLARLQKAFLRINNLSVGSSKSDKETQKKQIDALEKCINEELLTKKIHETPFAKKRLDLAKETTPANKMLTILFLELIREGMKKFGETLLQEINDLREECDLASAGLNDSILPRLTSDDTLTTILNSAANLPVLTNLPTLQHSSPLAPLRRR